jgi:hypothetical protein
VAEAFEHRSVDGVLPTTAPIVVGATVDLPSARRQRQRRRSPEMVAAVVVGCLMAAGMVASSILGVSELVATTPPPTTQGPLPATTTTTAVAVPDPALTGRSTDTPHGSHGSGRGKHKGHKTG